MIPPSDAADRVEPAGIFTEWLRATRDASGSGRGMDVPCGDCRGCCTSSYFIHIAPDETSTLSRIPKAYLFPAPGAPKGHRLLGYDDEGHCPMLIDGNCSIYAHRPRTCRDYDCRVFPATGIAPDTEKPAIAMRAARWRFELPTEADGEALRAARAAAAFLRARAGRFPEGFVPPQATQQAVMALKALEVFLGEGAARSVEETVAAVVAACRGPVAP